MLHPGVDFAIRGIQTTQTKSCLSCEYRLPWFELLLVSIIFQTAKPTHCFVARSLEEHLIFPFPFVFLPWRLWIQWPSPQYCRSLQVRRCKQYHLVKLARLIRFAQTFSSQKLPSLWTNTSSWFFAAVPACWEQNTGLGKQDVNPIVWYWTENELAIHVWDKDHR